jgi:hypothetical protein
MSEIARIREEMTTLVDNLLKVYLPWLKEQELAERKAKWSARLNDTSIMPSAEKDNVLNVAEDEGEGEKWKLTMIYTEDESERSEPIMCSTEGCNLVARCRWESSTGGKPRNMCLDCQEEKVISAVILNHIICILIL